MGITIVVSQFDSHQLTKENTFLADR